MLRHPSAPRRAILLTVLSLLAVACGGGQPAAEEPPGGTTTATAPIEAPDTTVTTPTTTSTEPVAGGAEPEVAELRVGVIPIIDVAPLYLAVQEGYFEEEGLTVTPEIIQGGAAGIPAMVSGELDLTFGNYISFFLASQQDLDIRIIAEGNRATPGFTLVQTLPDSGIAAPADLVGGTIAVNTLNNIAEITARLGLREAGVDPQQATYVEVPFPDMPATLERGDVDAIWAVEPFATIAASSLDAVTVYDPYTGPAEGLPVGGYQATTAFADDNPNTVSAFQRALDRAAQLATDDPQRVIEVVQSYTSLEADAASAVTQPAFVAVPDVDELGRVTDLMLEFELVDSEIDVASLVVPAS